MSSLQGDRDSIPTGEPKEVKSSPSERVVEAKTLDYTFAQIDRFSIEENRATGPFTGREIATEGFTYDRFVSRYHEEKDYARQARYGTRPQAEIHQRISTYEGTAISTKIETTLNGPISGHSTFTEERFPHGTFDNDETVIGFRVTDGKELPPTVRGVHVRERTVIYHPNEPRTREKYSEGGYAVERQAGDWRTENGTDVADLETISVDFDRHGNMNATRQRQSSVLRRSGWVVLGPKDYPEPTRLDPDEAKAIWENEIKSLVETAKGTVKAHPEGRLVLNPQDQYLVFGGISTKPTEPLKDFVAKEVLRAI